MVIKKQLISLSTVSLRRCSKQADGNTDKPDDVLASLRRVSETLGMRKVKDLYDRSSYGPVSKWKTLCLLSVGILTVAWGIASLIFTPLQMLLSIRIEMKPGFPPYEWWLNPPDEVLLKAYIFNITNAESFLNGTDAKLAIKEIGPIIYREKLTHFNARHNDNDTLTYTVNKSAIFLPEMNTINLNDIIYAPNLAALVIPSYFYDSSMFVKMCASMLLRSYNAQPIVKTTIQNYLWNLTDPILGPAKTLAPALVPLMNVGMLNIVYSGMEDNVTVFIGSKHGNSKFFAIDTYDGSKFLPHYSDPRKCQQRFRNASEGVGYPQMVTKDANLTYWRKTLCKLADIRFGREESKYGINGYRFNLMPWVFDRVEWDGNPDCFVGSPPLPNGLADVSPCYWGYPIVASFPHFLHGDDVIRTYVDGMAPNETDHGSYVLIEPILGIPLEGKARSQMNLLMKKFSGFPKNFQRFSDTVIPLAWLEYHQVGIPWYIKWLVYYTAVVVPVGQLPFSIFCLSLGFICSYFGALSLKRRKGGSQEKLVKNKVLSFESEAFLKEIKS